MQKYDYEFSDLVGMFEIVKYNEGTESWDCIGIYADTEEKAEQLKDLFNEGRDICDISQ